VPVWMSVDTVEVMVPIGRIREVVYIRDGPYTTEQHRQHGDFP